jgi:hypothetical protein
MILGVKVIKGIGRFYYTLRSLNLQAEHIDERPKTDLENYTMSNFIVGSDSERNTLELKITKHD